jgi:hypothetical protein
MEKTVKLIIGTQNYKILKEVFGFSTIQNFPRQTPTNPGTCGKALLS